MTTQQLVELLSTHTKVSAAVIAAGVGVLALSALAVLRIVKAVKANDVPAERAWTLVTSALASGVAAQGMYVFFGGVEIPIPLRLMGFAFLELTVITCAMRARQTQLDDPAAGPGADGIAMWVLTGLSGVLAATHAQSFGEFLIRLTAPLVAAWGWERSMRLERRQHTGKDGGINWRWSPHRLLVRWGLADPTDRTIAEVSRQRRVVEIALAADDLRLARQTSSKRDNARKILRAQMKLRAAMRRGIEDGLVLDNGDTRELLVGHLTVLYSAQTLAEYQPPLLWTLDRPTEPAVVTPPEVPPTTGVHASSSLLEDIDKELAGLTETTTTEVPEVPAEPVTEPTAEPTAELVSAESTAEPSAEPTAEPVEPAVPPAAVVKETSAITLVKPVEKTPAPPADRQPVPVAQHRPAAAPKRAQPVSSAPAGAGDAGRRASSSGGLRSSGGGSARSRGSLAIVPESAPGLEDIARQICEAGSGRRDPAVVLSILQHKTDPTRNKPPSNLQIAEAAGCNEATVRRVWAAAQPLLQS